MRAVVAALLWCTLVQGADPRLEQIRDILVPLRSVGPGKPARGATPAFNTVKTLLREWAETRIAQSRPLAVLEYEMNQELRDAGLFCGPPYGECQEMSALGSIGEIRLEPQGGLLLLHTSVGVDNCGVDESLYAYQQEPSGLRQVWKSEQNAYGDDYAPLGFRSVAISGIDRSSQADPNERMIVTLAVSGWCTSNWHPVRFSVWRMSTALQAPELLLNGQETGFIADEMNTAAEPKEVLFQYQAEGIEGGFSQPRIHRYAYRGGELKRTDPVATIPREFLAFWIRTPLKDLQPWAEFVVSTSDPLHIEPYLHEPTGPRNCLTQPDLWQMKVTVDRDYWALIRWRPPYQFRMVGISDRPRAGCTRRDPEADRPRSLFNPLR